MNAPLAALLPLEMLDHVREVNARAVDACVRHCAVQQTAGGAHERTPFDVFFIARLFPYHHDLRAAWAFAENGLRAALPEFARAAICCRSAQGRQIASDGKQRGGGLHLNDRPRHSSIFELKALSETGSKTRFSLGRCGRCITMAEDVSSNWGLASRAAPPARVLQCHRA